MTRGVNCDNQLQYKYAAHTRKSDLQGTCISLSEHPREPLAPGGLLGQ